MAAVELIVGGILVAASVFALMIALPKDGEVRSLLRNEHAQAYYAIAIIGAFVYGMVNLFVGVKELLMG
jgi:hypothetical protein